MAERALELLALPQGGSAKLILDLGCGSGLSGSVLSRAGHLWMGMDISTDMLSTPPPACLVMTAVDVASQRLADLGEADTSEPSSMETDEQEGAGATTYDDDDDTGDDDEEECDQSDEEENPDSCVDLFLQDMGNGVCFRPGSFDGCISISALQWLCHANRSWERPRARLMRLFNTLFGCLARGARAVFQFYPETSSQIDLILGCAMKAGFTGGLVVDYPNSTRAKKYYLCLMTGPSADLPPALEGDGEEEQMVGVDRRAKSRPGARGTSRRTKQWVLNKKELARKRGEAVKADSKYTARKRRIKF